MTPVVLTIPDEPSALAGWLERQLVGPDFARLLAELAAVQEPPANPFPTLDELLDGFRDNVLNRGLAALPPDRLKALLRQPQLLLDLQERVLTEGSDYWTGLLRPAPASAPIVPSTAASPGAKRGLLLTVAALVVAVAALILIAVVVQPSRTVRGWHNESVFASDAAATAYLNRLAAAVEEYRADEMEDAPALARRIGEIRDGCTRFAMARHDPLSDADRADVKARCRKWSDKLDAYRKELEDSPAQAGRIHGEVNALVEQMAHVLRAKAESIGA